MPQHSLPFELKELNDQTGEFVGYAAKYNNVDFGGDKILPGAFNGVNAKEVKGLWQHDWQKPIFTPTSFKDDGIGLLMEGRLVMEVQQAREALALAKANALGGLSIGYSAEDWEYEDSGRVRVLKKCKLWEVSMVTFPMNPEAKILDAKGLASVRDCERYLREVVGLSQSEAKTFISLCKGDSRDVTADPALLGALAELSHSAQTFVRNAR